jgi:hypothetical protein
MRTARLVFAVVVLGTAVTGTAWLASYRAIMLVASSRRAPDMPPPILTRVYAPVWWGAWAAIVLLATGIVVTERLLPERARVLRRSMEQLLLKPLPDAVHPAVLARRFIRLVMTGIRLVLNSLDWFAVEPVRLLVKRSG